MGGGGDRPRQRESCAEAQSQASSGRRGSSGSASNSEALEKEDLASTRGVMPGRLPASLSLGLLSCGMG